MPKPSENPLFSAHTSTLKRISYDDANREYMVEDETPAVNFDQVMKHYAQGLHLKEVPSSVDGLLFRADDAPLFLEFKNGGIDLKKQREIQHKLCNSVLAYLDMTKTQLEDLRRNGVFILIYNGEKNPDAAEQSSPAVQEAPSRTAIGELVHRKAKKELVRFGLESFCGYTFRQVHTYTVAAFCQNFPLYREILPISD